MVPMDVPKAALDMIRRFLTGDDFSAGNSMLGVSVLNIEDAEHCIISTNAAGVKRGGGTSDELTDALDEGAADTIINKSRYKHNRFASGLYSLFGLKVSKSGDSNPGIIAIFFMLILLIAVLFFLRFQKLNKQLISRR